MIHPSNTAVESDAQVRGRAGGLKQQPSPLRAAAWVRSSDSHRQGIDGTDLAARWIQERGDSDAVPPVVITSTLSIGLPISLRGIAGIGGRWAPQIHDRGVRRSVVVYVPDARTLSYAVDCARGYSLVAIEGSHSIATWATGVEAVNLVDHWKPALRLTPEVVADLQHAVVNGGINGWAGMRQREQAVHHLVRHIRSGALTPEDAAAYAVSHGLSDRSAQRLRALLKTLNQQVH